MQTIARYVFSAAVSHVMVVINGNAYMLAVIVSSFTICFIKTTCLSEGTKTV